MHFVYVGFICEKLDLSQPDFVPKTKKDLTGN